MNGDQPTLRTIGQLARRAGLPVRTVRFWSDAGILPPAGRSHGNFRLYDDTAVLRCELVRTLRELGLGLETIRQVLAGRTSLAQVAEVHVAALDAEISTLRLRRAVLSTVARRGSTPQEVTRMRDLIDLSAAERRRILQDFVDRTFAGLTLDSDGEVVRAWMREIPALLPDDPTDEQADAAIELAGLVTDPAFTGRLRRILAEPADELRHLSYDLRPVVLEHAGRALADGITPESHRAAAVVDRIIEPTLPGLRESLADRLELLADPALERFWTLAAVLQGRSPGPSAIPAFRWLITAVRARRAG
ncbi:MerR family transcriptional regulator [Actinoplanes philippinensis]|uniref:helix-turn-helix domain-containing protein n=1 Tax=Actinoplanes philippinensis TaxID=35752 RepID=UPI0033CA58EA